MSNLPAKRTMEEILTLPDADLDKEELRIKGIWQDAMNDQTTDDQMGRGVFLKVEVQATKERSFFLIPGLPPQDNLEAIVIYSCIKRFLYDQSSDSGPLWCQSTGGKTGKPTDEGKASVPFLSVEPYLCNDCPADEYGSGKEGRGKMCSDKRRLYLGLRGLKRMVRLDISPSSVGVWDGYKGSCDANDRMLCGMITKITLESESQGSRVWAKFRFQPGDTIPPDDLLKALKFKDVVMDQIRSGQTPEDHEIKDVQVSEVPAAANEPPPPSDADAPPPTENDDDLPF